MKKIFFLLVCGLNSINMYAQFANSYWKVGRHVGLDFSSGSPIVNINDNCTSAVDNTNTSICNSRNEIIFYSNACRVYNRLDQVMPNGSGFNQGTISNNYVNTDYYPSWKSATIIPFPNDTNKFYMFYLNMEWFVGAEYEPNRLYYLIVDKSLNGGLGDVTVKDQVVISGDTLSDGELMAVKHGNGKYWWIVCRKFKSDKYYEILVNSSGVQAPVIQHIGVPYTYSNTFNCVCNMSLDGTKMCFCYKNPGTPIMPNQIDVFDFDRCSGSLFNYQQVLLPNVTDTFFLSSTCFSPDKHFLYANDFDKIWQFDLMASNIVNSKIYIGRSDSNSIIFMQIGLDNKIYISPYGSANYIGVINHPDSLGAACDFQPYQIYCHGGGNYADGGLPNTPNFALGAVAPCGVGIEDVADKKELSLYPNPANQSIVISQQSLVNTIEVTNVLGQKMKAAITPLSTYNFRLATDDYPSGIYFLKTTDSSGNTQVSKFIKE